MDRQTKDYSRFNSPSISSKSDVFEPISSNNAKQRANLVEWLNGILPDLSLPINASDEELRAFLVDGSVLCQILNKLKPGSVPESDVSIRSPQSRLANLRRFLSAMDEMGLPRFQVADLEKGSMKIVLDCLLTLQTHFMLGRYNGSDAGPTWKLVGERVGSVDSTPSRLFSSPPFGEDRRRSMLDSKSQRGLRSPRMSAGIISHAGHKFHEVFQLKQGSYTDLPAAKISEMMKSNSLDNAPTQSLLSVVNGILGESVEMKNGEIPHRVACLLRKVVQEIERRICTQAEHLRTQNNLFKAREEKYQSRIRVLEALATGTSEETQIVMNQLQQIKTEKNKIEEKKKVEDHDTVRLKKEKDELNQEIANLKQQIEIARGSSGLESSKMKATEDKDEVNQEIANLRQELKEKDELKQEIANLKKELEMARRSSEQEPTRMKHMDEKAEVNQEITKLKKELEILRRSSEEESSKMRQEVKEKDALNQEIANLKKELEIMGISSQHESSKMRQEVNEKDALNQEIANLKKELEIVRRSSEQESSKMRQDVKEKDELNQEIANLKKALEIARRSSEQESSKIRQEVKEKDELNQQIANLRQEVKEKDVLNQEIVNLRQEMETARGSHEQEASKMKAETVGIQRELEIRLKDTASLLTDSRNKVKELEALSESRTEWWNKKQQIYHIFTEFQLGALRELRFASQSIQQEVVRTEKNNSEEFSNLGAKIKILGDAARNYYPLLAENRKMHNELQELKGNIRVYCRIRPFLPGQKGKQSIIEYIGEDGELAVVNPSKPGKEGRRSFKFDKVYGPPATQAEVFTDTQPLIQSVLDGYNVCIFAYGQTGSGKTYTMTGPDGASEEEWGVNYRALNNLFGISQSRESIFKYEVSVQMVEIYNEQVRDLLSSDVQKKLGILTTSQPNGLAVPDACIQPVNSTADVLKLMDIGLKNRAKSSTAMNERSSRSHSIVSIHTRGLDLKSGSSLRGSLHLVDLAGSERVDRSEVTGDRLKEAQHINKSLSALGDVIFALAQKSAHVPYRNSKLTQVLQSSLGGRAKTLMFVQLNPDATSFGETLSTLKFAERVSGVELGAAKSSKDGRDVRELMEQVASLKDTIAKKDEEIEALQVVKDPKSGATEVEGSGETAHVRDEARQNDSIDKPKLTSRVPQPPTRSATECPKGLNWHGDICVRKPVGGTNLSSKTSRKRQ